MMTARLLALLAALALATSCAGQVVAGDPIPNQYIVTLLPNCDDKDMKKAEHLAAKAQRFANKAGGEVLHKYEVLPGFAMKGASKAKLKDADTSSCISSIEQDRTWRLDVSVEEPRHLLDRPARRNLQAAGDTIPPGVSWVWGVRPMPADCASLGIAWVIDTGIVSNNSDLNVIGGVSFVGGNYQDQYGHGTHVAGTIAARNNGAGVVGVCPGARLFSVRVFDRNGRTKNSSVLAGINYVGTSSQAKPGDVANLSLGGGLSDALDNAVVNIADGDKAIRFAIAAGNSAVNANTFSPARAASRHPRVFAVAALDIRSATTTTTTTTGVKIASFTNYDTPPASLTEPGNCERDSQGIVKFAAPGVGVQSWWYTGVLKTISGTSMATPHLAGLMLSEGNTDLQFRGNLNLAEWCLKINPTDTIIREVGAYARYVK